MRRVASSFSRNPKSGLLMFTSFCGRARTAEGAACTSVPVTRPVCLKLRGPAFRHPVPNAARALGYFWGREPKVNDSPLTDHSLQVVRFTREGVHQGGFREREIRAIHPRNRSELLIHLGLQTLQQELRALYSTRLTSVQQRAYVPINR